MKKIINAIILSFVCAVSFSQNIITGSFSNLANQQVKLIGFYAFDTNMIDSVKANDKGLFHLSFGKNNYGMGYLVAEDNKPFFVVLSGEDIKLKGESFALPKTIEIQEGTENQIFELYASEHPRREQALSAWYYLEKIYNQDSLFNFYAMPKLAIAKEKNRIKAEDSLFLSGLDPESYVSFYLPVRKLISSVSTVAQYRTEEIPATINAFRKLDYADERLYKSGLLKDAIETHFWLLENMGQPLDTVFKDMSISIDCMEANLTKDEKKFNEITKCVFDLLEKHSLSQASEYMALKVLTQNSCTVNDDLAKQLESYRTMKKGNTAPDIVFSGDVLKGSSIIKTPNRLSDIQSSYKVIIFGASWCPTCAKEIGQLLSLYKKWKSKGVEVVFISLDTDNAVFRNFTSVFPFISMCDYKKWSTQAVLDYYVFATPTMFLLDNNQKIILRPNSVKQVDAWVDYYIGE